MDFSIDQEYLLRTLSELVRINSVNPSLSIDGKGEAEICTFVADSLIDLGLDVKTYQVEPGRMNVAGLLKGNGSGRSLLLNAHMDTVGIDGMVVDPFGAEVREGKLFGRGAQDMKGSLAAMVAAVKALVEGGIRLPGDLWVTGVADEEYRSIGMDDLVRHVVADGAIVTEPTDLTLCRAHRGFIWYDVETFGKAAHGSRVNEGIDANMRMGRFLSRLDGLEQELRRRPAHPLVGPPSLHAATLHGGVEISIYAAYCKLQVERRTNPGETEPQATAEIQAIIDSLSGGDATFKASLTPVYERKPYEVSTEARIVRVLENVMRRHLGTEPAHSGQTYWTDAAILAEAGVETALIGPRGGGLHSEVEWVEIQSVVELAEILADTAIHYCV